VFAVIVTEAAPPRNCGLPLASVRATIEG